MRCAWSTSAGTDGARTEVRRLLDAAIVCALAVLYAIEPLLTLIPGAGGAVARFGPAGLSSGASGTAGFGSDVHLLGQVPAGLMLAGYALIAVLAAAALRRRRDITV